MSNEQQLREILANWDVPGDMPITDIWTMDDAKCFTNVWKIGDELILKKGERTQILKNMKIAKALAAQGFQSAMTINTRTGAEYLDVRETFVLTKGIGGSPLEKSDIWGEHRADYGYRYGVSIAKLHNALVVIEHEIEPDEVNLFTHITEWALPEVQRQNSLYGMSLPDSFFDDYTQSFGTLYRKLPKQLIHRDPNPSNILFSNGEVSGFIHFDCAENNVRLWDICYCATGILSEWHGVENICAKWLDILSGVFRGYNSENELTTAEKRSVWYVLCSIHMVCAAFFEASDAHKELAMSSREMLVWIAKNRNEIERRV